MAAGFDTVPASLDRFTQAGQLADLGDNDIATYVSEEGSAEIPFGVMVAQGTEDNGCLKMAVSTDKLVGVVVATQAMNKPNELGDTGILPGIAVSVMKRGRIVVTAADAVTPADPVRVNESGGTFQTGSSGGVTTLLKHARWLTTAGAGELAVVEFDMLTRADNTQD
jgi:hypothetical protein